MQQLPKDNVPVEPYTPKIKSIELDYTSTVYFNGTPVGEKDTSEPGTSFDQLYHVYPFGTKKVYAGWDEIEDLYLLPRFSHMSELGAIDHSGEFFIGFSHLKPPQQISLLVKMSEGSGNPSLEPPDIHWFYLSEKGWAKFEKKDIVRDSTNGLLDSGILRFNIPADAIQKTSLLPGDHHWIKAAIHDNAAALSRVINIQAQVLKVTFDDHNNDPGFLSKALPAQTINKLKNRDAAIKKINQPYASEGGKVAERDDAFYRRVNERLRHKDRGVTIWDYERMVLQHFPAVYKVKCINHSVYGLERKGQSIDAEFAPGYVTLVMVPDLHQKNAFNPLTPRVSLNLLEEIKCYLKKKIPVFAAENLDVCNPLFEHIQVDFKVEFFAGKDEGYYRQKLVNDITAFLSPWAYEEGKDIVFGGSLHKSVILNFVEERSYVDFVTNFEMYHYIGDSRKGKAVNEVTASEARSVLTSYPAHLINDQSITATQ